MKDASKNKVHAWVAQLADVPASVLQKMARSDESMYSYSSPSLRLIASPNVVCGRCLYTYDGDEIVTRPITDNGDGDVFVPCDNCGFDLGWEMQEPSTFPCGWSTLFAPRGPDRRWFVEHADRVAKLGFFVFESEDYGVLLGIDAAGFDFYDAYWRPLLQLRRGVCMDAAEQVLAKAT